MWKILIILFAVVLVTNPLTNQVIQPEVIRGLGALVKQFDNGWTWIVIKAGWITTVAFMAYLTGMFGYLYAKMQLKDMQNQNKHVAKAKTSKKRDLGNMKYELTTK